MMLVEVLVGMVLVVSVDGFWLSVKGSSMLSIVQEYRGGLLSRHRAWGERGEKERERWRRHDYQAHCQDAVLKSFGSDFSL